MTKIKMCGLTRASDIEAVNMLRPDFIGLVFAPMSRRCVSFEQAAALKEKLVPDILTAGVFVNEDTDNVAGLLECGTIDIAQLHGNEDELYVQKLRQKTDKPIIQAFRIRSKEDVLRANRSTADNILLDAGSGTGFSFDWELLQWVERPFFLAGGLNPENAEQAVRKIKPYALDVSSGIETDGLKDRQKMAAFMAAVRRGEQS